MGPHSMAAWGLTRIQRHPRWGANRRIAVVVGQLQAFTGEPIDIRRLHVRVPEAGRIRIPHIIDIEDNDIGLNFRSIGENAKRHR